MARSINANLLRRWITEAEADGLDIVRDTHKPVTPPIDAFVALP